MELNKNLTNTNRGKGMKTFKQHIKEGSDKTAAAVGSQTTNSVEDGSIDYTISMMQMYSKE